MRIVILIENGFVTRIHHCLSGDPIDESIEIGLKWAEEKGMRDLAGAQDMLIDHLKVSPRFGTMIQLWDV